VASVDGSRLEFAGVAGGKYTAKRLRFAPVLLEHAPALCYTKRVASVKIPYLFATFLPLTGDM
jgi:hypothetical protein